VLYLVPRDQTIMRRRVLLVAIVLVALVGGVALWRWYDTAARNSTAIRGSGVIEVTQSDVAFEIPGRILERFVDEGAMLDRGEPVARLDDREYRLQVERAAGAKAAAEARYRLTVAGAREQEVDQALAALESADSEVRMQRREYDRIAKLFKEGVASQSDFDRMRTALDNADAVRTRAAKQLDMLREGFRTEEIEEARGRLQQAKAELELAELNLARCQLFAPISGRVLSKSREVGEVVQPGTPIVTVGDLSRPWVNVYIGERDLGKVQLGMQAYVTVDSFPQQPFPGHVTFVADRAEFTPKNIQTPDERVKLVYRIKVEVATRDQVLKPGMPADAVIPLTDGHGVAQGQR
jgi:HlyD family secretion protein